MQETHPPLRLILPRKILLTVAVMLSAFRAAAQEGELRLPVQRLSAQAVFDNIQRQTPYRVAVNNNRTDELSVSITRANVSVKAILERLLHGSDMTYRVDGRFIVITKAPADEISGIGISVARTLSGRVTDGVLPIEGVTVRLMDAESKQVVTGRGGRFSIGDVYPGRHIVRLSTADDSNIRFREVEVPGGGDADVTLDMGGMLLSAADATQAPEPEAVKDVPKMTTYFLSDHQPSAITKKKYSLISSAKIKSGEYLPRFALKTNMLYLATATPNLSIEFGLTPKWTLNVTFGVNPWKDLNGKDGDIRHFLIQPEARYWFSNRFENHFIGMHGIFGSYRIGNIDLSPFKDLTGIRYRGQAVGAGLSYGYHAPMGRRWAWEFTIGAGYLYIDRKKYDLGKQDSFVGSAERHYFGLTKAGVSLIFMIR